MASRRKRVTLAVVAALLLAVPVGWATYAAVTWSAFGRVHRDASADSLLGRFMARYDIAEVHRTRTHASMAATFDGAQRIALRQSPVIAAIFTAREALLGAGPDTAPKNRPLVDELRAVGWGVLANVPQRQLVLGAVTKPWEANVTFRALPPAEFARFDSSGYVKIVVTFAVDSGTSGTVFREETRALATDPRSREKFRRYWSIFSPGILLIRREAMALVRHRAESLDAPPE